MAEPAPRRSKRAAAEHAQAKIKSSYEQTWQTQAFDTPHRASNDLSENKVSRSISNRSRTDSPDSWIQSAPSSVGDRSVIANAPTPTAPTWATAPAPEEDSDGEIDELSVKGEAPAAAGTDGGFVSYRDVVSLFESCETELAGEVSDAFSIDMSETELAGEVSDAFSIDMSETELAGEVSDEFSIDMSETELAGEGYDEYQDEMHPFVLDEDCLERWEELLDSRRGGSFDPTVGYSREEVRPRVQLHLAKQQLVDSRREVVARAKSLKRPPHPHEHILRLRYAEAEKLIKQRAKRREKELHGWQTTIMKTFTDEDRFSFFAAGSAFEELVALAGPTPPDITHVKTMSIKYDMKTSSAISAYNMTLIRSAMDRIIFYEGCTIDGVQRWEYHQRSLRAGKNHLMYNCMRKFPKAQLYAYRPFSLHVGGKRDRITALVLAARVLVQFLVEAPRHHWMGSFAESGEPSSFWGHTDTRGTNGPCPATHGIPQYSYYTKAEKLVRKKAQISKDNKKRYEKLKAQTNFTDFVRNKNQKQKAKMDALPYNDPKRVEQRRKAAEKARKLRAKWGGRTKAAGTTKNLPIDHPDRVAVRVKERESTNRLRKKWGGHTKAIGQRRRSRARAAEADESSSD